jgi:hypothetical protein
LSTRHDSRVSKIDSESPRSPYVFLCKGHKQRLIGRGDKKLLVLLQVGCHIPAGRLLIAAGRGVGGGSDQQQQVNCKRRPVVSLPNVAHSFCLRGNMGARRDQGFP